MGIAIAILAAVFFAAIFRGAWDDLQSWLDAADADDAAFEQRRADRQERIRQQNEELAHRCLMETCETVCIGNWRGCYGKKN